MGREAMERRAFRTLIAAAAVLSAVAAAAPRSGHAAGPNVLRVGTYKGVPGQFTTIQAAADAAQPGDWILVAPGDYHEQSDREDPTWPAGVWIDTPGVHLRGMDRNTVVVDGTKPGSPECSSNPSDQDLGVPAPGQTTPQGRNGIEVFGVTKQPYAGFLADNVSIENLTVCNFVTSAGGGNGNEIWWDGGDGLGKIGMNGYTGDYLTATSTYSNTRTDGTLGPCCGVTYPSGSYGIFSSDATHGSWDNIYASNMADSSFYIGACQQRCDFTMNHAHGQVSALCLSTTNAGGYMVIENTECDNNKTGLVSNSQNNDDWPSPQHGACDTTDPGEPTAPFPAVSASCTVWANNYLHDNNNPNVPGNGTSGLAGGGPVGTGAILAGTNNVTIYNNRIENNNAWGELIVDLPDQEGGPANCHGGIPPDQTQPFCYWSATGNMSIDNVFDHNGGYGNPTNGDVGLATLPNNPGNCYSGDVNAASGAPNSASSDPPAIEGNPLYAPSNGACTTPNAGDEGALAFEALCASQLAFPCPTVQSVACSALPSPCPIPPNPAIPANYPRPDPVFTLEMPPPQPTMPNPCAGVPANPWCAPTADAPESAYAALPLATGGLALGAFLLGGRIRLRRRARER